MGTYVAGDVEAAGSPPWPLAVGVLLVPPGLGGKARTDRRLKAALDAYQLGYYLLDLVEVDVDDGAADAWPLDRGWARVQALVDRAVPDVLVVAADVPCVQLPELPARLGGLPLRLVAA